MGNQSSKNSTAADGPHRHSSGAQDRKSVNRRISIQALSSGKATAADPSASRASATAQNISLPFAQKPALQKHLQATYHDDSRDTDNMPSTPSPLKQEPDVRRQNDVEPEPSDPMNVPTGATSHSTGQDSRQPSAPPPANQYAPGTKTPRPPRLPLPIANNEHVPGSPLLEPIETVDEDVSVFEDENAALPRRSSMLSSTTADDIEVGDELQPFGVDTGLKKSVPVEFSWRTPGDTIFVVGTFSGWAQKYPLRPRENGKGQSTTIPLPPGTHHLKFIVNGNMRTSDELPTTVDFHNVLVNYLEVSAEDEARSRRDSGRQKPTAPQQFFPPQVLPEKIPEPQRSDSGTSEDLEEAPEEEIPGGDFRMLMPQALTDLDLEEGDAAYEQAVSVIQDIPGPPTLPLFLGRSILNGNMPMKDDNSVLTLPNHTVLNHLATSSIRNGVLATSVTTRYKRKYVTTIMYKPTERALSQVGQKV